jgi:DNA-binding NtrC family response regulator
MPGFAGKYKILIIDDERSIADTLALVFSKRGYEAKVAYSAEQAIDVIAEWQPDLAIIDVVLPKMNGVDLAIVLKSNYPFCRLLLFSGSPSTVEIAEQAAKKGHFFEILAKPVHPTFLLNTVMNLLAPEKERQILEDEIEPVDPLKSN